MCGGRDAGSARPVRAIKGGAARPRRVCAPRAHAGAERRPPPPAPHPARARPRLRLGARRPAEPAGLPGRGRRRAAAGPRGAGGAGGRGGTESPAGPRRQGQAGGQRWGLPGIGAGLRGGVRAPFSLASRCGAAWLRAGHGSAPAAVQLHQLSARELFSACMCGKPD